MDQSFDEELLREVDELIAAGDSQNVADELIHLLEGVAEDQGRFGRLVEHYQSVENRALLRVLTFFVASSAIRLQGESRNLVYKLVPAVLGIDDASSITNCCTAVQRLAMTGVPWHPEFGAIPRSLVGLVLASLNGQSRNAIDGAQLLEKLAETEVLARLGKTELARITTSIERASKEHVDEELADVLTTISALQ